MVFSTNKADRHDITEILLKLALNTITLTLFHFKPVFRSLTLKYITLYYIHDLVIVYLSYWSVFSIQLIYIYVRVYVNSGAKCSIHSSDYCKSVY